MRKTAVLAHFKDDPEAVAAFLGISRQAVALWPAIVPETSAYKLHVLTAGQLRADPAVYARIKARRLRERVPA